MEKQFEVLVKVDWDNVFVVYAESKEAAAAKAKETMEKLMENNISYDTKDLDAEVYASWDKITVVDTIECDDEEYAYNVLKEEQEAANEIKGLVEWIKEEELVPIPHHIAIQGKVAIEKYYKEMKK